MAVDRSKTDLRRSPEDGKPAARLARRVRMTLVVSASALGFLMLALGDVSSADDGTGVSAYLQPATGVGGGVARLRVDKPEGSVTVENGEAVPLAGGGTAEVTVFPYPPTSYDTRIDLLITDPGGDPMVGARVSATWDMLVMFHGPFTTGFDDLGNGHYMAGFDLFMFGPWGFTISIEPSGASPPEVLNLSIYVWPE